MGGESNDDEEITRIRLINWHYFVNETININGSFLISGENTAGKSTILDAIQLVLTTNTGNLIRPPMKKAVEI